MTTDEPATATTPASRARRVPWQTALVVFVMWRLGKIVTRESS